MKPEFEKKLLNIVKNNYDQIADKFNQTRKGLNWPSLTDFISTIPENSSVLDAGCGNGRLYEVFQTKHITYFGFDNCQSLIKLAETNFPAAQFAIGDLLNLDFLNKKKFDYIFCIAVISHLPGNKLRLEALKRLKQHLNPGGKLVLSTWNLWSKKKTRNIILKMAWQKILGKNKLDFGDAIFNWQNGDSQRYYHGFTSWSFAKLAKQAGFKIEKQWAADGNYYLILK